MLLAAVSLLGGVALVVAFHGLADGALTTVGWILVTCVGFVFVGLQAVSSLMMVSLAEQNEPSGIPEASDARINDRNSHEPKTTARP